MACKVLGVDPEATEAEIKSAYRELAKRLHPDNHPQQTERIREAYRLVVEAYGYTEQHPEEKERILAARAGAASDAAAERQGGAVLPQGTGGRVIGSPVGVRTQTAERARERKQFDAKAKQEREARKEKMQEDLQARKAQLDQEKKEKAILNEIRAIRIAAAIRTMLSEKGIE